MTRVAVATTGNRGLEDYVSTGLGCSNTFTIVDIEDGKVVNTQAIDNPANTLSRGRGPVVAMKLAEMNVSILVSGEEIGPGVSAMLDRLGIRKMVVRPGRRVVDVLRDEGLITAA